MIVNKDQIKGRLKEAEGKAREVAGKMAGNKKLELKGNVQGAREGPGKVWRHQAKDEGLEERRLTR